MNLGGIFDLDSLREEVKEIEQKTQDPAFWENKEKARSLMSRLSFIKKKLDSFENLERDFQEIKELVSLAEEDPEIQEELTKEIKAFEKRLREAELEALFTEEEDRGNAILSIHPGAGGTESQDWAQMLFRMYMRWVEKKGFKVKVLDLQPGEEAGIKDATILVEGPYAYGYLKAERGIHRLVRISPFDATRRRHTSFASVFVYPELEDIEVEIKEEDIKIDTFRSSGPGGQHMQKNETAVRITHIPTGIVVSCQSERSQYQNKMTALRILKARLYEYEKEKERERMKDLEEEKGEIAWGHQIRSYVLHPYQMVKDHRTGYETGNAQAVLDGEIDEFIWRFLLEKRDKKKETKKN